MNDMRDMRYMQDGRRLPPRNSRGEFRRRRRGDRGMDGRVIRSYPRMDYGDMNYDMARGGGQGGRGRGGDRAGGDYGDYDMARGDMRSMDYRGGDYRGGQMMGDGHHYPKGQGATYYPIQAMGTFEGYYGMPEQDYGRGRGRDYGYDMRGSRDYGYDYGYPYGDFGETLSEEELEAWCKKLKGQLDEREKQMFPKEMIAQKAKQMGKQMEGFGEKELEVTTLMVYTDYKNSIGQNPDLAIKLAFDWLTDKDVAVKGANKLAVYFDEIVMGGEDD